MEVSSKIYAPAALPRECPLLILKNCILQTLCHNLKVDQPTEPHLHVEDKATLKHTSITSTSLED
jgi:hypothetical protein